MNKKLLISFVLSSTLCAPYARAMSGLLPRARQVAAMVMNPGVRAALTQTSRAVSQSAACKASRAMPEIAQSVRQPMTQNLSRSFVTQAPKAAQKNSENAQNLAIKASAIGLAVAAASPAVAYASEGSYFSLIANGMASLVGVLSLYGIITGYPDITPELLVSENYIDMRIVEKMIRENSDYARQFAEHVTVDSIKNIRLHVLLGIMKSYPEAAKKIIPAMLATFEYWSQSLAGLNFLSEVMELSPEAVKQFTSYALANIELWEKDHYRAYFLSNVMKYNPEAPKQFILRAVDHCESLGNGCNGMKLLHNITRICPEIAKQCAPHVVAHIESLVKDEYGVEFLTAVMKRNPETAKQLTPYAKEHIESLGNNGAGMNLLCSLMEHDPEAAKQFTPHAVEHIESLTQNGYGKCFLRDVMTCNPEAAKQFTPHAVEHIGSLAKTWYGRNCLMDIIRFNPEAAKQFTPHTAEHIESLVEDEYGTSFLQNVMFLNPEAAKQFTPRAVARIEVLAKDKYGMIFLRNVMFLNSEAAKQFTAYAVEHIESLAKGMRGLDFLRDVIKRNSEAAVLVTPYVLQSFGSLMDSAEGRALLASITSFNALAKTALLTEFKKNMGNKSDASLSLWEGIFYRLLASESLTPTELGLLYAEKQISELKEDALKDPTIKQVADTVIGLERKYEPTHYTFTHGRNRAYDYVSTVYGKLWHYAYNTEVPEDFIFTHTKDAEHDPLKRYVLMQEERKLHTANITEHENSGGELRNRRLFLNTQLFGNMGVGGSSSFSYFLLSSNASGQVKVTVKDIFAQFDQSAIYEKYKDEFQALEKEHTKLSAHGELLAIAVPKERVNEDVTCMTIHGTAAPQYMINGKMTNDVREILQARKKDPSIGDNELNFTLAMTDTAALNPASGIKIHSIQGVDRETYAAWQAKLDALMVKIEAEFKDGWNQKVADARVRHQPIYDAIKPVENAAIFHRMKSMNAEQQHPGSIYPGHSGSANYAGQGK